MEESKQFAVWCSCAVQLRQNFLAEWSTTIKCQQESIESILFHLCRENAILREKTVLTQLSEAERNVGHFQAARARC